MNIRALVIVVIISITSFLVLVQAYSPYSNIDRHCMPTYTAFGLSALLVDLRADVLLGRVKKAGWTGIEKRAL